MLSREQCQAFEERGFVRLSGVFSKGEARAMEERVWKTLGRRGVLRDAPDTWTPGAVWKMQDLKRQAVFDPIGGERLVTSLDQLLGAGRWHVPRDWGQFLISFPSASEGGWDVPHRVWHTDFGFQLPQRPLAGTLLFSFLADVPPRGGGTLVVEGSHRLMERFLERRAPRPGEKMKVTRLAFLASDPWLRALSTESDGDDRVGRFLGSERVIGGLPVRVAELCAEAGDVILCHPWILHATSDNAGREPRMMRVQRVHLEPGRPDPATRPRS